jgi:hypothetical protein
MDGRATRDLGGSTPLGCPADFACRSAHVCTTRHGAACVKMSLLEGVYHASLFSSAPTCRRLRCGLPHRIAHCDAYGGLFIHCWSTLRKLI